LNVLLLVAVLMVLRESGGVSLHAAEQHGRRLRE
jgi:hypothetical protein